MAVKTMVQNTGTGKTYSLRTLNPVTTKVKATKTKTSKIDVSVNGGGTEIPTTTTV